MAEFTDIPNVYITVPNPAFETYVERVAIQTCDSHGPSPCGDCLRKARDVIVRKKWAGQMGPLADAMSDVDISGNTWQG